VQQQIDSYNQQIEKLATEKYPESELLRQPWGVGAITSVSYLLTIEDKNRLRRAGMWAAIWD